MKPRRISALASVLIVIALALPASASAWKWTFRTFDLGGGTTGTVQAKKCKGPKVGFYDYTGTLNNSQIQHTVTAKMPAFPKFRDFRNVNLTVSGPSVDALPPDIVAQIVSSFTAFYEETKTKYNLKKGKLTFNHPPLSLFGSQVIPAGTHTEKFKPTNGC
jgi:hypothetical protein